MKISFSKILSGGNLKSNGLYKIVNIVNGHWYVGSTSMTFCHRFNVHRIALRKGKHANSHLQNSYNKYGEKAFVFITIDGFSGEECLREEQRIINEHFGKPYFYNESKDASAPMTGRKHSKEAIVKISIASKKRSKKISEFMKKYNLGKKHTPESIEKMRVSATNRDETKRFEVLRSDKVRAKISKSLTGRKFSKERHDEWIKLSQSAEYREKMSESTKGIPKSDIMKSRNSLKRLGKQVVLEKNGITEILLSIRNFCEKYSIDRHEIRKVINGKRDEFKGWRLPS